MSLPSFAVRRPISVFMIFIVALLFGALGLMRLPVDLMPSFEFPMVSVVTSYPGAGSEDIETTVTEVIEDAVSTISGVKTVTSVSQNNISVVSIQFEWGTDLNEAANDVRDELEQAKQLLPSDAEAPMLVKISSTNIPILVMGATAKENYEGLRHLMQKKVADPLKRVPGVAQVVVFGGPERQINVTFDPAALAAVGIPVSQAAQVLSAENLDMPAGDVKLAWTDYTLRVTGRIDEPEDFRRVIIGQARGKLVRLGDVATVTDSFAEMQMEARADRVPGVVWFVSKQSGANSVTVTSAALKRIDELKKDLPPDVTLFTFFNTSDFIKRALRNLSQAFFFGAIGVILIVLLFLRRWRSTLVIGITIPASLMVTFFVMYVAGYTINIVSLMSLAIAVGMVVDAAIVVLENVTRHVESGERVKEASVYAPGEIGQAITASTLTTVVVFVPMLFVGGITGVMSKQMAVIVIVAISMSLFAALTLTPALSSTLLRGTLDGTSRPRGRGRFFEWGERWFKRLEERYAATLTGALAHKKRTVWIAVIVFVVSLGMLKFVKTEFLPSPDSGEIEMTVELAPGTTLERTMGILNELEAFIEREIPERDYLYSYAGETGGGYAIIQGGSEGSNIGIVGVKLVDQSERQRTSEQVAQILRTRAQAIPSIVKVSVSSGSSIAQFMGMGGQAISIQIQGDDSAVLERLAVQIREAVRNVPGAVDVDVDFSAPSPEFHVTVDRSKASALGLNVATIASALRSQVYGLEATKFREAGDEWDVFLRAREQDRANVEDIEALPIPSMTGQTVRLSSVATVSLDVGPTVIRRQDQQRIVKVQGRVAGRPLGQVIGDVRGVISEVKVPAGVDVSFGGDVEQQTESFRSLALLLLLSIVLVYMVMAAQFESLLDPFIVMFSIPFAFVGVIWAFLVSNTTLSMTSFLGVVMLMGIVVNNAIVLVDYTNLMRKRGLGIEDAVVTSGRRRLRPVLMTAFTTIVGMLPLAILRYTGSEVWRPLGVSMVGGLLVSTVVTLVLVPTIYTIFETRVARRRKTA